MYCCDGDLISIKEIRIHDLNPSEKAGKPNPTKKNQIEQVLFGSTIETILGMVIRII